MMPAEMFRRVAGVLRNSSPPSSSTRGGPDKSDLRAPHYQRALPPLGNALDMRDNHREITLTSDCPSRGSYASLPGLTGSAFKMDGEGAGRKLDLRQLGVTAGSRVRTSAATQRRMACRSLAIMAHDQTAQSNEARTIRSIGMEPRWRGRKPRA